MRTFVALEVPLQLADEAAALARQLAASVEGRFVPRENYHVTLAFTGDVAERCVPAIAEVIDEAGCGVDGIPLRPDGLGKFGRAGDATLWLGFEHDDALAGLAKRVRDGLDARGIRFDDKPFRPHLTLARRANVASGALSSLAFPREALAHRLTLFKSTLSPDGARYEALHALEMMAPRR